MADPQNIINTGLEFVFTDQVTTISSENLEYLFEGVEATAVEYTLEESVRNGTLFLDENENGTPDNGELLAVEGIFTQEDINAGRLLYEHDSGTQTQRDRFFFDVDTGDDEEFDVVFASFLINNVIYPLEVTVNEGLVLPENTGFPINGSFLTVSSFSTDDPATIEYTLTRPPQFGTLFIDSNRNSQLDEGETALAADDTFTQSDIFNNLLAYQNTSEGESTDSFAFTANKTGDDDLNLGDNEPQVSETEFGITITDVDNQAPEITTNTTLSLAQGATVPITAQSLSVEDPDTNPTDLVYVIQGPVSNGTLFIDDDGNGELDEEEVNLEFQDTFTQADINQQRLLYQHDGSESVRDNFSFQAQDTGGRTTAPGLFQFSIGAAPEFGDLPTALLFNLAEAALGNNLLSLEVDNAGENTIFSISGNEDRDGDGIRPFRVNANNQLVINDLGDITGEAFALTLAVTNPQGAGDSADLTIDFDSPPVFAQDQFQFDPIDINDDPEDGENAVNGTPVGVIDPLPTDPEGGEVFLEIVGGNDRNNDGIPTFIINQAGQIRINSIEEIRDLAGADGVETSFSLTVSASDENNFSSLAQVLISVDEPGNDPPRIPQQRFELPENAAPGAIVGEVNATDADGDELTFSLEDPTGNFIIDEATGVISVAEGAEGFDFEGETSAFGLDITVTDGETSVVRTITVSLTDVDEFPPEIIESGPFDVNENALQGTIVGTVVANDPDGIEDEPDALTFTITEGNPDTDEDGIPAFAIDNESGQIEVNDPDDVDFDEAAEETTFNLTVEVSDSENSVSETVTINVINENDPPNVTFPEPNQVFELPEDAANGTSIFTVEANDPEGQLLTFAITEGNTDLDGDGELPFAISAEGELTVNDTDDIDFETQENLNLTLAVTDADNQSSLIPVTIALSDVNEPPVIADPNPEFELSEDASVGDLVGQIEATDPEGNLLTFTITEGNVDTDGDGRFAFIISDRGRLFVDDADEIDFETQESFNLNIEVSDGETEPLLVSADISILDVNEPPEVVVPEIPVIDVENPPADNVIVAIAATDPEGEAVTFGITEDSNPDNDEDGTPALAIDENTGQITIADLDDFTTSLTPIITVTDADGEVTERPIRIIVNTAEPDPPTFTEAQFTFDDIAEDSEAGTEVGTVTAIDPDDPEGDPFTFSFTEDNLPTDTDEDGELPFEINPETGVITVNDSDDLDFETQPSFTFGVTATGEDELTSTTEVVVNLADVNEPPEFTSPDAVEVAENTTIVSVTADDPEGEDVEFFLVDGADVNSFTINRTTGELSFNTPPDFENPADADGDNVYEVEIQISDGFLVNNQTLQVTVTNVNEPPEFTSPAEFSVDENTTAVGAVTADDPEDDDLTFTVAGGADAALFTLDQDGNLSFNEAPNFEDPADADGDNVYEIEVQADDGNEENNIATQAISITVNNLPEEPSVEDQTLPAIDSDNFVDGFSIGTLTVTNPEGVPLNFAIIDGNPNGDGDDTPALAIGENTGEVTVADSDDLFLLEEEEINLIVSVAQGDFQDNVEVTIAVTIFNQPPVFTSPAEFSVDENTTEVGAVTAEDPDGDDLTFTVIGGADAALFTLDQDGNLSFNEAPDFENPASADDDNVYEIEVQADDGNGGITTQNLAVTVNDVNETPVINPDQSFSIDENSTVGTAVGTVRANDPEDDEFSFSFDDNNLPTDVDGDGNLPFVINPETGFITVNDSDDLDFETQPSFTFGVSATETEGDDPLTGTGSVTVNLNDVPEIEFDLDVDDNGEANGSVDGLNILRVLFNLGPETMDISQAPEGTGQQEVFNNIGLGTQGDNPPLDVDNSGAPPNGSVDGLNTLRFLFNLGPETMDISQAPEGIGQQEVFNNIEALDIV